MNKEERIEQILAKAAELGARRIHSAAEIEPSRSEVPPSFAAVIK